MINEPTGWSADCDHWTCKETAEQEEHTDGMDDWIDTLRQWGWIVLGESNVFHSLDCLLRTRADSGARTHMGEMLAIHARFRHDGMHCCPDHGKHRADGEHDWRCPVGARLQREARWAAAAARKAATETAAVFSSSVVVTTIPAPAYIDPEETP